MSEEAFSESQAEGFATEDAGTQPAAEEAVPEATETDAPTDSGQAEVEDNTAEQPAFNVDDYRDQTVKVKVNGEELEVPLGEALAGYQRQADYTRSKQELAEARAIQQALQADPKRALEILGEKYGVNGREDVPSAQGEQFDADDPVTSDPRYRAMMEQIDVLSQDYTARQLDSTLDGLSRKYGDDFDEQALLTAAAQRGVQHPSELEGVYRDLMFDKFYAQAKAQADAQAAAAGADAKADAAAAAAEALVASGNGAVPTSAGSAPPVINDLDDAFEAAARTLGIDL